MSRIIFSSTANSGGEVRIQDYSFTLVVLLTLPTFRPSANSQHAAPALWPRRGPARFRGPVIEPKYQSLPASAAASVRGAAQASWVIPVFALLVTSCLTNGRSLWVGRVIIVVMYFVFQMLLSPVTGSCFYPRVWSL